MSDDNRSPETGQFTAAEPAYGQEGIEREAGFVPYKEEKPEGAAEPEAEITVDEAAEELTARQEGTAEGSVKTYSPLDDLADNVTLTVEQAAKFRAEGNEADATAKAEAEADKLRAEIDELRGVKQEAEAPKPEPAKDFTNEDGSVDYDAAVNALPPKVREAVSAHVAETETARRQHLAAVNGAAHIATATFLAQFPEFQHIPENQRVEALRAMAQQDPARVQRIAAAVESTAQLFEAQRIANAQEEQAKAQRFQEYAKTADARFNELIKDVPADTMRDVPATIIKAVEGYGGNAQAFFEKYASNEFLRDPIVQRMMVDAARYHMVKDAPLKAVPKGVPPVQRPGTAQRISTSDSQIAALRSQIGREGVSQEAQLRAAAAITQLRRRG